MLLKFHDQRSREEGFTLIELLVVVIIIGILAAIAIPVFLAQRERAWRSSAQSDLRNAAVSLETYYTDEGFYAGDPPVMQADGSHVPAASPGAFDSTFGFNPTNSVEHAVGYSAAPAQAYCLAASHQNHNEVWYLGSGGTLDGGDGAGPASAQAVAACPDATARGAVDDLSN